nr:hypothetical protein [Nesterenkonia ebinurensis]
MVVNVAAGMQHSFNPDDVRMLEIEDEVRKTRWSDVPKTRYLKNLDIAQRSDARRFGDRGHSFVHHVGESIGDFGSGIQEVLAISTEKVFSGKGRELYRLHGITDGSGGRLSFGPNR